MHNDKIRNLVLDLIAQNIEKNKRDRHKLTNKDWDAFYANRDIYMRELDEQENQRMRAWIRDINDKYYDR